MKTVESPFMETEWEKEQRAAQQRFEERLIWLAYGVSAGLLIGFALMLWVKS